ncbi:MAG: F0F1 ATP synthase subunit delta [Spirochaetaceae bacterium]|jgi:F0F1-type ATP synthase delta subunit|nr:F0F1 ATP synthase subunit delta [Spirochaetaceae bacterium]
MFAADRWAEAFIEICGDYINVGQCETGLAVLKATLHSLRQPPPYTLRGSGAAARFSGQLADALEKCGYAGKDSGVEAARAVVFLLIQRDKLQHIGSLIDAIENLLLKKRNILTVVLDCAEKPDEGFLEALKSALKKRKKSRDVRITAVLNPELLAGYRINIDSEREDFSVLGGMRQLERVLAGV